MRDKERGVVWEESIVMLPSQVRFVFLSATIPNATLVRTPIYNWARIQTRRVPLPITVD